MEKVKFNQIVKRLDDLVAHCESIYVSTTVELDDLTLGEVRHRIEDARLLQGKMDKILCSELYHLLGMGDLTSAQTMELVKRVRMLTSFRPYIKPLATSDLRLRGIPSETEYACEVLRVKLKGRCEK